MGRVEKSIEIKAPPEKIWEMLPLDRLPEWDEGTQKSAGSVEYTSEVSTPEEKYKVGATARSTTNQGSLDFEITESLKNKRMSYRMEGSLSESFLTYNLEGIITYNLELLNGRTKFTYVANVKLRSSFMNMFMKMFLIFQKKETERSLKMLKNILEK